jgi:hypothetical protein
MNVSLSKHNNRTVLKIESGYRKGEIMESSEGKIQYFKNDQNAFDFAIKTGYFLVLEDSEKISKELYQNLLNSKCDLPENCKIYTISAV